MEGNVTLVTVSGSVSYKWYACRKVRAYFCFGISIFR